MQQVWLRVAERCCSYSNKCLTPRHVTAASGGTVSWSSGTRRSQRDADRHGPERRALKVNMARIYRLGCRQKWKGVEVTTQGIVFSLLWSIQFMLFDDFGVVTQLFASVVQTRKRDIHCTGVICEVICMYSTFELVSQIQANQWTKLASYRCSVGRI